MKIHYYTAVRSKILSKLIFASCVWYSNPAYYDLCVLIMDIGRRLPLQLQQCSYQGQQGDFSQSVRVYIFLIRILSWGQPSVRWAWWWTIHSFLAPGVLGVQLPHTRRNAENEAALPSKHIQAVSSVLGTDHSDTI